MNYKRFSYAAESWNKKPIQLLSDVPPASPPVQQPVARHLQNLTESRAGVFANFKFNTADGEIFSEKDIAWYTSFFDQFSTPSGRFLGTEQVAAKMEATLLPFDGLVPMADDVEKVMLLGDSADLVEPIVHANQTTAEKADIRAAYKARDNEKPKLCRGARAVNAATQRVLDRLEREADERLGRTAQFVQYADELDIVGADISKAGFEAMYLCHWVHPRWAGHALEFQWIPASSFLNRPQNDTDGDSDESGADAEDDELGVEGNELQLKFEAAALLNGDVKITWQNEDLQKTVYKGKLVEQGIGAEQDWFRVQYSDGDAEWLSLKTLETDGTLGSTQEKRVQWCLCEHQDAASSSEVPQVQGPAANSGIAHGTDSDVDEPDEHICTQQRQTRAQAKKAEAEKAKRKKEHANKRRR